MSAYLTSYSPKVLIYLEIGEKVVRLADVLCNTATLYSTDPIFIPPFTRAMLVISLDGLEHRKPIVLTDGISVNSSLITFSDDVGKLSLTN